MGRWSGGTPSLPTQLPTKRAPDGLASLRAAVRLQPAHTHSHRAKREEPGFRNPFCSLLVVTLNELLFCHLCHGGPVCLWESLEMPHRGQTPGSTTFPTEGSQWGAHPPGASTLLSFSAHIETLSF